MECKKYQEYIAADYIDKELPENLSEEIENHIKYCRECMGFLHDMQKTAVEPFKLSESIKPPESVWENIKSSIEPGIKRNIIVDIKNRVRALFNVPRYALALGAIATTVFIFAISLNTPSRNKEVVNDYLEEQIEFISYLENDSGSPDEINFDTAIENYFM
ncbi:MAG: zf-HC2 domain-containing protein [bacterium]